ncbi:hypothetical protein [Desulfovibrio sp. UCD-KL4C]|uniref:hypothetical protein n=1 Tax=Desulfovibrio sp. UCD-KL4C TaxID=2578120 RepID=UPI0025C0C2B7|nr:hypothetical protein [Desulfovibrio sp. UCD-KL4C]
MRFKNIKIIAVWLGLLAALASPAAAQEESFLELPAFFDQFAPVEFNGFIEARVGARTQNDPDEKEFSMAEVRMQGELFTYTDWADFKYKGDVRTDAISNRIAYETRELWMFSRPSDFMDMKIGRQVLTWGTGGLVFLNDLFPKDWRSFFMGRDVEYLKAPCNAAKVSFFTEVASIDMVYSPQFEPDRYIDGEYISYWSGLEDRLVGRDNILRTDIPDEWFKDDEVSARIYRNINNYELAMYGYWGYWKQPAGMNSSDEATFPPLNVYGASIRGQVGSGIGNIEVAWYDSTDSRGGTNAEVDNSQIRYLVGYAHELWPDSNCEVQYYVEQMLDYGNYQDVQKPKHPKDEFRHVITVQFTQQMLNQNLTLVLDSFYSPSDEDAYLRPSVQYKVSDQTTVGVGANFFIGATEQTFFGQFSNDSSIYTSLRYSF